MSSIFFFLFLTFPEYLINRIWLYSERITSENMFVSFTLSEIVLPEKSILNVVLVVLFVCITPAFFEEIAFRGIILGGLKNGGKIFAILVSGAVFSLFHMSPLQTVYQFIVVVLYAFIVLNGGDYSLTFISHFFNNSDNIGFQYMSLP